RGAAIAFYTVTSIAPVLLIVIAVAGLAFGREAAQNAIIGQLSDLMGQQTAEVIQTAVASAASKSSGILATIVGIVVLLVTASGVFGEMQAALNAIWKAKPKGTTVSRLIRARAASLGLVVSLGFLLMVSLVVSTVLTAFGNYLDSILPFGKLILPQAASGADRLPTSWNTHRKDGADSPAPGNRSASARASCLVP
ncbi:MAG: YhjD/YihY/BrkB family envelope integrity protein, partial [Xanthobacteraceae bacterium]